jgi:ATP-dependent DNA helicase RecQ
MNAILIVICPLNALIDSHLKELKKHGIKGCSLNDGMYDITDLTNGKYSIIFTNPESLILNKNWRTMLQSSIYQENLFGIVADEAHVVPKW